VIIHLIHLHRRRTIEWAAMMFLLAAQQMNRGYSRLRQMLILALRVLAVLGLIFLVSRPLAGGWLGLTRWCAGHGAGAAGPQCEHGATKPGHR